MKTLITQNELKQLLSYDKKTGLFTWISNNPMRANVLGTTAGSVGSKGYINIEINNRTYKAHRLAWLYVTGSHPLDQIDHKNQKTNDNSFDNLREADNGINQKNSTQYANNNSGATGVYPTKSGKFKALIRVNKKLITIGTYSTKDQAVKARQEKNIEYGFHNNHGNLKT